MAGIKNFDYNSFPVKKTIFELIKPEQRNAREAIDKEIKNWQIRFSSAYSALRDFSPTNNAKKNGDTWENYLLYFNDYNNENNIKIPVKKDAESKINDLFASANTDTPLMTLLKERANEQNDLIK